MIKSIMGIDKLLRNKLVDKRRTFLELLDCPIKLVPQVGIHADIHFLNASVYMLVATVVLFIAKIIQYDFFTAIKKILFFMSITALLYTIGSILKSLNRISYQLDMLIKKDRDKAGQEKLPEKTDVNSNH